MAGNMKQDPEFAACVAARFPSPPTPRPADPNASAATAARQRLETSVQGLLSKFQPDWDILTEVKHTVKSYDGHDIIVYEYARNDLPRTDAPSSAFLYYHGGGNIACPIDPICRPTVAQFAEDFGVRTFGVEFRLAPEHPYPTPVEDCYAALVWLMEKAPSMHIDPARIGLFGESGGGGLVAGVALMARDRKLSPPVAKQMMAYPMLDDCSSTRHYNPNSPRDVSLSRFVGLIDQCWAAYLGPGQKSGDPDGDPDGDVPAYAAPARATELSGLPPTYIDCGGLDWFRDETLELAARLAKADVDVELHLYSGVPHVFDLMAPEAGLVKNAKDNRRRAVQGV